MRNQTCYNFTLILSGADVLTPEISNALYEAGCDDGSPASSNGVVFVSFDREAPTFVEAVTTAICDVESAGNGLRAVRVETERDDLVGPVEIAERIGQTRQSVHLYITGERGPGDFPRPVTHVQKRTSIYR
jgi:hypothetical protein